MAQNMDELVGFGFGLHRDLGALAESLPPDQNRSKDLSALVIGSVGRLNGAGPEWVEVIPSQRRCEETGGRVGRRLLAIEVPEDMRP